MGRVERNQCRRRLITLLIPVLTVFVLWTPLAASSTYHGQVLDEETGKPVEGVRVLCSGSVVDHGLGNWFRYKILGGDWADTDPMILDAAVTGADGSFKLVIGKGRPYRTISINKNGAYGVFSHNTVLSDKMVIRIKDQPLSACKGSTTTDLDAMPDPDVTRILFATHARGNGYIYCLNSTTGDCLWRDRFFWDATSPVLTVGARAFVGTEAGLILAYDLKSGQRLWQCQTHQEVKQIRSHAGRLYVAGGPGYEQLLAIDQATGRIVGRIDTDTALGGLALSSRRLVAWSVRAIHLFALPSRKLGSLGVRTEIVAPHENDAVYTVVRDTKRHGRPFLVARSWESLALRWECPLPQERFWRRCFVLDNRVIYVVGDSNIGGDVRGKVCAFDTRSGRALWAYETAMRSNVECVIVPKRNGLLFLHTGAGDQGVFCLSADSAQVLWRKEAGHVPVGHTRVVGTDQPVVLGRGFVRLVNPANGNDMWSYPSGLVGNVVGLPVTTRSSLFVVEAKGDGISVVRLSAENGMPVWCFTVHGEIMAPVACVSEKDPSEPAGSHKQGEQVAPADAKPCVRPRERHESSQTYHRWCRLLYGSGCPEFFKLRLPL